MRSNAALSIPFPHLAADAFTPYTLFVVTVAMLFGGGARAGLWSDVVVELAALPLLGWAMFKLAPRELSDWGRWAVVLLCAIVALPLLQLIPMPPEFWSALPGRADIAPAYQAAGLALPWLPLSLDPAATWRGLLALIPAAAVFLAMLSLEQGPRRLVLSLILIVVFGSVLLDLLQIVGGTDSPLRFYAITNPDRAVGFFANANHNAAFLYCAIPFAAALAIGVVRDRRPQRTIKLTMMALLVIAIIIGLAVGRSRAGVVLGLAAGVACLLLAWFHDRGQSGRRLFLAGLFANAIGLLVAFQFGFFGIMERVEQSEVIEDIRWPAAAVTASAAVANMPFGTGFGTFVPVFEKFAPRTLLRDSYVNHAHNDWIEVWLTGGVPAILLLLGFLVWFSGATVMLWRSGPPGITNVDIALARAASIVIVLLLLHCMVDYPLRTAAMSVWFAIACAYLIPGRNADGAKQLSTMTEGAQRMDPRHDSRNINK